MVETPPSQSNPATFLSNPATLQTLFDQWSRLIAGIITALAGAGSFMRIESPYNVWIAVAVAIAGIGALYYLDRRRKRQLEDEERRKEAASALVPSDKGATAFRMLRRYRDADELPGKNRRDQSKMLARDVSAADFKISVVAGESGAGKSSLLEASLTKNLRQEGRTVVLIHNALRLPGVNGGTTVDGLIEAIEKDYERQTKTKIASNEDTPKDQNTDENNTEERVTFIVDQFEELLTRFHQDAEQAELGQYLGKKSNAGVGLVIGIRKEFTTDLKRVLSPLGFDVGFTQVFQISNFDPIEAQAVLEECANYDKIKYAPGLPEMIIKDLSVGDRVRPADLQIVCGMLARDFSEERYKKEGRAVGLQSRFISSVIDYTGDRVLVRTILRELCDIQNNKKAQPQTADEIAARAREGAPGARATLQAVEAELSALEQARIVAADNSEKPIRWSLIHDYLVKPIVLATEQQSSLAEAAAGRLDYYLEITRGQWISTIPLNELLTIRRNAPPAKLADAKALIRRSLVIGYGRPVARTVVISVAAAALLLAFATQHGQWRVVDKASHWKDATTSRTVATDTIPLKLPDGRDVVVFGRDVFNVASTRFTVWDAISGQLLATHEGRLTVAGGWIWNFDGKTKHLHMVDLLNKTATGRDRIIDIDEKADLGVTDWNDQFATISIERPPFGETSILNFDTGVLENIKSEQLSPQLGADSTGGGRSIRSAELGNVRAISVSTENYARLSIVDKQQHVLRFEDFDPAKRLLMIDSAQINEHKSYLFIARHNNGKVEYRFDVIDSQGLTPQFTSGEWIAAPFLDSDRLRDDRFRNATPISFSTPNSFWIWKSDGEIIVLDAPSGKVNATHKVEDVVRADWVPSLGQGHNPGWAWTTPGKSGTRILAGDMTEPAIFKSLDLANSRGIDITPDETRILSSDNNKNELWSIDPKKGTAERLLAIDVTDASDVFWSRDQNVMFARSDGGMHQLWGRDGKALGSLGTVGAAITWSTYNSECRRLLIWDRDGQRLDFRRGFEIPIFGFVPERSCLAEPSLWRQFLDVIIP